MYIVKSNALDVLNSNIKEQLEQDKNDPEELSCFLIKRYYEEGGTQMEGFNPVFFGDNGDNTYYPVDTSEESTTDLDRFGGIDGFEKEHIKKYQTVYKSNQDCIKGYAELSFHKPIDDLHIDLEPKVKETADNLSTMLNKTLGTEIIRKNVYADLSYRNSIMIKPFFFTTPLEFTVIFTIPYNVDKKSFGKLGLSAHFNIISFTFQVITEPLSFIGRKINGMIGLF